MEDVKKLPQIQEAKVFGENLLHRLQQATSDKSLVGKGLRSTFLLSEEDYRYTIKRSRGLLGQKVCRVSAGGTSANREVIVYDQALRETIESTVSDLNVEGELNYKVTYRT